MKKLKKVYQDAAILRHKMLKYVHRKKSRRRKEAIQEYALEQADMLTEMVHQRQVLYEVNKLGIDDQPGPFGSIKAESIKACQTDERNMFDDLIELSLNKEIREKRKVRQITRRLTESRLKNYDKKQNPVFSSLPSELVKKRPRTGISPPKLRSRTLSVNNQHNNRQNTLNSRQVAENEFRH